MAKFKKRLTVLDAITFNELVEIGITIGANIVDGMPWSFEYKGYHITHENDECYLINTLKHTYHMTPKDMLITNSYGEIYTCPIDMFEKIYIEIEE